MDYSNQTCATCRHWHRVPADAHSLGQGPQGECRQQLRVIGLPGPHSGFGVLTIYPRVVGTWAACGQYLPAPATTGSEEQPCRS